MTRVVSTAATIRKTQRRARSKPRENAAARQRRRWLRTLVAVRVSAAAIAVPLFPFLFHRHYFVLAFLRPSAVVLVGGGFLARRGNVALWQVVVASIPMQVLAVWLYYAIGRAWAKEIGRDDALPVFAARLLPARDVKRIRKALRRRGPLVVVLTRFAIVPVGLVAAAAGDLHRRLAGRAFDHRDRRAPGDRPTHRATRAEAGDRGAAADFEPAQGRILAPTRS